jgi:hypothetical protein
MLKKKIFKRKNAYLIDKKKKLYFKKKKEL